MAAEPARAATAAAADSSAVEAVIVTGTRQTGVRAVDSAAPVQVVDSGTLSRTGQSDLRLALSNLAPSFTAQAFGGDAANLTLSARLRGTSANQTLVLINGKRCHTTANLAVLAGAYQGSAAADLNFIPVAGISRIEVLTDGAAAQYGTIGRIVDASEIAWLVAVLASPLSGAINGQTLAAGGGTPKVIDY
jgi:iron complex outermembrane receptor protein